MPNIGGTGGGIELTITGINFANSIQQTKVYIGNTPCDVNFASSTEIKCITREIDDLYSG